MRVFWKSYESEGLDEKEDKKWRNYGVRVSSHQALIFDVAFSDATPEVVWHFMKKSHKRPVQSHNARGNASIATERSGFLDLDRVAH